MTTANNDNGNNRQVMQAPQAIKIRMISGEIASCDFCNKFESNAIGTMASHISSQHYADAGTEGWLKFVTLTGKRGVIVESSPAQTLTPSEMLANLSECKLSIYDKSFFSSLYQQFYARGYLTEKQLSSISKMHTKYRKQVNAHAQKNAMDRANHAFYTVKLQAKLYKSAYSVPAADRNLELLYMIKDTIEFYGKEYRKFLVMSKEVLA